LNKKKVIDITEKELRSRKDRKMLYVHQVYDEDIYTGTLNQK